MPEFLAHVYIKRKQSNYFQCKLLSIPPRSTVIQLDFSENYTLQHQGEVQLAHWNQDQLTLFTICVCMPLTRSEGVQRIDIFSDGPLSQFKNQYVFNCLPMLFQRHGLDRLNWHFFATSHGKGAVDGIGGVRKFCLSDVAMMLELT